MHLALRLGLFHGAPAPAGGGFTVVVSGVVAFTGGTQANAVIDLTGAVAGDWIVGATDNNGGGVTLAMHAGTTLPQINTSLGEDGDGAFAHKLFGRALTGPEIADGHIDIGGPAVADFAFHYIVLHGVSAVSDTQIDLQVSSGGASTLVFDDYTADPTALGLVALIFDRQGPGVVSGSPGVWTVHNQSIHVSAGSYIYSYILSQQGAPGGTGPTFSGFGTGDLQAGYLVKVS